MRRRINIPLVEFESKVPVVKLKLGDRELFALADTGSESTLFDERLKDIEGINVRKLDSDMSFVGLQGKTDDRRISILSGEFRSGRSKIRIAGIGADLSSISHHFKKSYDSDIVISVLLGCDFLDAYEAVIDFDTHKMTLINETA
jgi:hypothetical protein